MILHFKLCRCARWYCQKHVSTPGILLQLRLLLPCHTSCSTAAVLHLILQYSAAATATSAHLVLLCVAVTRDVKACALVEVVELLRWLQEPACTLLWAGAITQLHRQQRQQQ
jgi:hypothetical protein